MKIQIDVPEDVHKQLSILKPVGGFKTLAETCVYVIAHNLGDLVNKNAKQLRREIHKENNKGVPSSDELFEHIDSRKTKIKRSKDSASIIRRETRGEK